MKRVVAAIVAAVVLLGSVSAGVSVWLLTRNAGPDFPEISAFTHGELTRVGPYYYCNVLNLTECTQPESQGELQLSTDHPVQLSVPASIGRALWSLQQYYEDPNNDTESLMPPGTLAVTVPSVDPQRGRLTGIVVRVPTRVILPTGEEQFVPHAEWSVRTVWND